MSYWELLTLKNLATKLRLSYYNQVHELRKHKKLLLEHKNRWVNLID